MTFAQAWVIEFEQRSKGFAASSSPTDPKQQARLSPILFNPRHGCQWRQFRTLEYLL
ncbi:hypothetical protein BJX70DRAFT_378529 [Aspergillus crustosus]